MKYLEGVLHNVIRRRKQILKVPLAMLTAAVFITIVVISGESLRSYQNAINKKTFGKWFIFENSINMKQSKELSEHPYLIFAGKLFSICHYYTEDYQETSYYLGYMDSKAYDTSSLSLCEGYMPQNDHEIAIEKNTLTKLGYQPELGQRITVYYYDKSTGQNNIGAEQCSREYTLTGILENYAYYWDGGKYIPTLLVTKKEAESYGYVHSQTILYTLDEKIQTTDYKQIYQGMKAQTDTNVVYNSKVYDYEGMRLGQVTAYAGMLITVIGFLIGFSTLLVYHRERIENYRMYSRMGLEMHQFLKGSAIEGGLLLLPAAAAGVIIGTGVVSIALKILLLSRNVDMVSVEHNALLKAAGIVGILSILFVIVNMFMTFLAINQKQKKRKRTIRKKKRSAAAFKTNNVILSYILRGMKKDRAVWILRSGFSLGVILIITMCLKGIADTKQEYNATDRKPDLIITRNGVVQKNYSSVSTSVMVKDGDEDVILSLGYHLGNLYLLNGMPKNAVKNIEDVQGVERIEEVYVENNERISYYSFFWQNQEKVYQNFIDEHGMEELIKLPNITPKISSNSYNGKKYQTVYYINPYMGTESLYYYVKPQRAVYEELTEYIDPQYLDYEAFENGEQLILFIDADAAGLYNTLYSPGESIEFYYKNILENVSVSGNTDDTKTNVEKLKDEYENGIGATLSSDIQEVMYAFLQDQESEEAKAYWAELPEETKQKVETAMRIFNIRKEAQKYNQDVTIAGVVYLNDEIKENLYAKFPLLEKLSAQNVIMASENLVHRMYQSNAQVFCELLEKEYNAQEYDDLSGNILCVNYSLDSIYQATDNIVQANLEAEGFSCFSNVEENNVYRMNYINKILIYMITIIALSLIYILMIVIWNYFTLQAEKDTLKLYAEFGVAPKQLMGSGILRYILEMAAGIPIGGIVCVICANAAYCGIYFMVYLAFMFFCGMMTALMYSGAVLRGRKK